VLAIGVKCHIAMNVHAQMKDSFHEELEHIFNEFCKYHMKILLGGFSAKVSREDNFKPTIGNYSLHEISNSFMC
jgi:hypothetical protein